MKKIIPIILFIFLALNVFSQKIISGKSELKRLIIEPNYERGLPPDLYVEIDFKDDDNDGLLEAEESALITLKITNKGKGNAQGLNIFVKDDQNDPALTIKDGRTIPFLLPNESIELEFPIKTLRSIKGIEHKMEIVVTEHFGYDMDPAYLLLNTQAFQEPELVFSGFEIIDVGAGTGAITEDGQIQSGEMVKAKIVVQNIGQNVSPNTSFQVNSLDDNIYLSENSGNLGDIQIGEVKEFWITISPNKRVETSENLPLYLNLKNDFELGTLDEFNLPIKLNQIAPEPVLLAVEADLESQKKKIVRFISNSSKITANIRNIINVKQVPSSITIRPNAVAIVIGIEKYQNFIDAPYAANDAELMEDYFKNILGVDNDPITYTFIHFLPIPSYSEINSATLRIYCTAVAQNPTTISIYLVTGSWVESQINWNNRPSWNINFNTSFTVTNSGRYYEIDIKKFVEKWKLEGNHGLVLRVSSGNLAWFNSAESSSYKPQLYIVYQ